MKTPKSTIPYGRQTISLGDRLAVFRSLGGRNLTQGPKVQEFEEKFADFCGSKFAIAFSSGTAALHASAFVTKVAHNSPTYTSGLTFVATANAIVHAGGKVQLLDIDPASWNINLGSVPPGASSLFTVDFAGLPTNLPDVEWEPGQKPSVIVEDCAHSLGGSTPEGTVGNGRSATVSCFSLHPVKGMTTGEGGMATTNDPAIAEALKKFRSHGISQNVSTYSWEYDAEYPGFNYRMTDFQASLGISQLRRLPRFIDLRNEIADRYRQLLGETSLTLPPAAQAGYRHAYHLFPVLFETSARRENAFHELRRQGITVQVHYRPVHMHTAHKELAKDLPTNSYTEDIASRILSIPIFPGLKQHQQMRVVKALKGLL